MAMSPRSRAIMLALVAYSALTTLALVWLLGRASVAPATAPASAPKEAAGAPQPVLQAQPPAPAKPAPHYPLFQSTIPKAFRGSWDEIISDKCEGREPRFWLGD